MIGVTRFDETWHRLREWTAGQAPSERLAAQVLDAEGYEAIDPTHPLGGPDGGADALVMKDGGRWVMAVYFPRGQQTIGDITKKFTADLAAAKKKAPDLVGFVFVTNQELALAERRDLCALGDSIEIDLIHLERLTMILDTPRMSQVREQFLDISAGPRPMLVAVELDTTVGAFDRTEWMFKKVVEWHGSRLREDNERAKDRANEPTPIFPIVALQSLGLPDSPPPVLSDDEITERIKYFREELAERWPLCQDYLAGVAWPAVGLTVVNKEASFLTDVQIILTFPGVRGIKHEPIDTFKWQRLEDPSWQPPVGPYGMGVPTLPDFTPRDYPVSWEHNDDGDLEITIDLPNLRPHPPWRHTGHDVVLVLREPGRESVTVTYTVTAADHGTVFEGEPIELPVERIDMVDSVRAALAAARDED